MIIANQLLGVLGGVEGDGALAAALTLQACVSEVNGFDLPTWSGPVGLTVLERPMRSDSVLARLVEPDQPYLALAVALGVSLALQPPINAVMARVLGSTLLAASISIAISLVLVLFVWLTWGKAGGDLSLVKALPWWVVLGGVIGVVFVADSIVVAPALGLALFFVCIVAGQLLASTLVDHFGGFGLPVQPVSMTKLAGLGLVLIGAALESAAEARSPWPGVPRRPGESTRNCVRM